MVQSKVFNGVIWASIQRFGTLAITFVSNMVLARLLTPDDFGTIGMLLFFLALAQTFIDSGFGAALIQKKDITEADINTVFYINMGMSILGYFILFVTAPFIASFYNVPILSKLLRIQSLSLLINGFTLIQTVQLTKKMDFKKLSICNLIGTVALSLSGIGAALLGFGVWSLVIRTLAGAIVTSVMLWSASKWIPKRVFSKQSFKELFSFGGFMLLSNLLTTVSNNFHSMIIGKLFSPSTLGNFTQARTLRNIPSESISSVIGQVLYPDFSNHQDNDTMLKQKLERSAYILSYVVVPLMFFCILVGDNLVHIVYGSQWDEAIPYFKILCLGGIPLCLQDINVNVIKARGRSGILFSWNLVKVIIYCGAMILSGKLWGIYGFVWTMVAYSLLAYLAFAVLATHCINTTIIGQIKRLLSVIGMVSIPTVIVTFVDMLLLSDANMFVSLIIDTLLFWPLYVLLSYITKCDAFIYLKDNIKKIKHK